MDLKKVKPLTNEFLELSGIGAGDNCLVNFVDTLMIGGEMILGPDGKLVCDICSVDSGGEMESGYKPGTGFASMVQSRSSGGICRRPRKTHVLYGEAVSKRAIGRKKKGEIRVPKANPGPNDGVLDSTIEEESPSISAGYIRNPSILRTTKKISNKAISIEAAIVDSSPVAKTPGSHDEKSLSQ